MPRPTAGQAGVLEAALFAGLVTSEQHPQSVADALGTAVEEAGAPDNHTAVVVDLG